MTRDTPTAGGPRGGTDGGVDAALAAAGMPPLPRTAWLEIDLDAIAGNLRAVRAAVPAGVRVEPVVKADAYGHGAIPVTRTLEQAGADGVSVATWDEAVALRRAGIGLPVLVVYPVPPALAPLAAANAVTLTLGDETMTQRTLEAWVAAPGSTHHTDPAHPSLRVEIEVETGLGRGGLRLDALPEAVRAIAATPGVELVGAWSHLGSPDDAERSSRQARAFAEAQRILADRGVRSSHDHLAASGGLLAGAAPFHDAVRPGLSTYGVVPEFLPIATARSGLAAALQPAMRLVARPVRVVDLPAGVGVSYGNAHVTSRPSRIATLPIGYADGYQRIRTNRVWALVRGERVPLVGTIAMDAVMADVTDVPGPAVTIDDEFVLLGRQGDGTLTAAELAHDGTTISWEVLAGMARRLPRVYYAAGRVVGMRTLADERGACQSDSSTTPGEGTRPSGP